MKHFRHKFGVCIKKFSSMSELYHQDEGEAVCATSHVHLSVFYWLFHPNGIYCTKPLHICINLNFS